MLVANVLFVPVQWSSSSVEVPLSRRYWPRLEMVGVDPCRFVDDLLLYQQTLLCLCALSGTIQDLAVEIFFSPALQIGGCALGTVVWFEKFVCEQLEKMQGAHAAGLRSARVLAGI